VGKGTEPEDPLYHLFIHSDCDGKIDRKYLKRIIHRLEELLPEISKSDHHYGNRNWYEYTEKFIAGAKEAHKARHHLIFG
jgi:hypothetical protein